MARTAAGAALTTAHRQGQMQIRARSLRDFARLWPLWEGDDRTFARLVKATLPLVRVHYSASAGLASAYYQSFRTAEGIAGEGIPRLAPPVNADQVVASLYVTGQVMTGRAIAAGYAPQAAMQTALVRTSGAVGRQVLEGGRATLIDSTQEDAQAQGWTRVTSGAPCAFCAMLAGRGPVYGEESGAFEAHDHCSCTLEPTYADSEWPGRAREFHDLYRQHAAGRVNPLQEFRRAYEGAAQ